MGERCGTFGLPEGSPDREQVDRFREFLAAVDQRGVAAVAADPEWTEYVGVPAPPPAPFTCPRCGSTTHLPEDLREGYCAKCRDWTGKPADPAGPADVDRAGGTIT